MPTPCGEADGCNCFLWGRCRFGVDMVVPGDPSIAMAAVLVVLRGSRFLWANEVELQEGLAAAFDAAGLEVEREARLDGRSRIDFLVDGVGVEVKVKGAWRDVSRQVDRYCASDKITGLVLVTAKALHDRVPLKSNGKQVWVHRVGSTL